MALRMRMADGTEPPCHTCGKPLRPGDFKIERPMRFDRHNRPGEEHTGAKHKGWVHEKCAPTKSYQHTTARRRRKN